MLRLCALQGKFAVERLEKQLSELTGRYVTQSSPAYKPVHRSHQPFLLGNKIASTEIKLITVHRQSANRPTQEKTPFIVRGCLVKKNYDIGAIH